MVLWYLPAGPSFALLWLTWRRLNEHLPAVHSPSLSVGLSVDMYEIGKGDKSTFLSPPKNGYWINIPPSRIPLPLSLLPQGDTGPLSLLVEGKKKWSRIAAIIHIDEVKLIWWTGVMMLLKQCFCFTLRQILSVSEVAAGISFVMGDFKSVTFPLMNTSIWQRTKNVTSWCWTQITSQMR